MKTTLAVIAAIVLVLCRTASAQTEATAVAPATNETVAAETTTAVTESTTTDAANVTTTETTTTETTSSTATTTTTTEVVSDAPTFVGSTNGAEVVPQEPIIPLIQFQDVQLSTAIENLARQANINYILDPRVGFGGPADDKAQARQEPIISIRWEKVTASQALTALLANHGLQIVQDQKTKISRITIKDPAAPDPLVTKILQLKFASPSNVIAAVQGTLVDKRSRVIGDIRTSQLVIVATEKEQDAAEKLVTRLDTQTRQVLIEAKMIETSKNPRTSKGIDWSGTLAAQTFTFGNGNIAGETTTSTAPGAGDSTPGGRPLATGRRESTETTTAFGPSFGGLAYSTASGLTPAAAFLNADGVNAVLSFLNQSADARVIATPRAVTLDNETAHLSVTRAEPIFKVQASTQNTTGGSEVTYTNLGVILNVTPRISANNYINLRVVPEVSRVFATRSKTVADTVNEADAYDLRRIETTVMIPSAHTLVMGGLLQDDVRSGHTKVPILGDLPIIGLAFRKDTKQRDQNNLLIFVTPTVIGDADFQVAPKSTFLQTPPMDNTEEEWSAWDSGKPADWSNPSRGSKNARYSSDPLAKGK
jgi:type II secretory pathway component GspD/PulD (secretin)